VVKGLTPENGFRGPETDPRPSYAAASPVFDQPRTSRAAIPLTIFGQFRPDHPY
jgi:hypothetical protein